MLCLAEAVIFPCGGHVLERLSTLKWLGDEEEVVRSDRKVKGVIMALNIAPWKSNYPRNLWSRAARILFQIAMWVCDR